MERTGEGMEIKGRVWKEKEGQGKGRGENWLQKG